ncbi:hypothetical protein CY34DRAFT_810962 [Suillus luteus UH-Slu-Lm8-n1]|uniref:F-box domain-containing protein n=1 Tax=Suillus luteus UH-Slu-Lm8-n1 TaxID=930992 RepID=A0A0D0AFA2_9AGAM|nr:hypothetical protein CY34DRAFT_810962 [Suillus luteus UH-Slu-Lm8-n1]
MDGVQTLQQQLVRQKNKINESVNLPKGLASPVSRLPSEVLSEIFYHCLGLSRFLSCLQLPSKLTAPLLLTRICRRWREVAVDMPNLWCMLSVAVTDRNWQQVAFCYESWLKRTRGRPLSLSLWFDADDHSAKLQRLLQPYANQVTSLRVNLRRPDAPELNMFTDFRALQEMIVDIEVDITTAEANLPASVTRSFSQLPPTLDNFTVSGLTTLDIEIWQPEGVHHLLQLAPNLSSLTIFLDLDIAQDKVLLLFTHTKLQTLHVTCERTYGDDRAHLCDLLNGLSLPALREHSVYGASEWYPDDFMAFLARSECPLESLIIGRKMMTDDDRADYLALVPSLRILVC